MKNNPEWIITPDTLKGLMEKRLFLQFYGIAEYMDVFKNKHYTKWCGYSAPDKNDVYACPGGQNVSD